MAGPAPSDPLVREHKRRLRAQQVRRRRIVLGVAVLVIIALVVILVVLRPGGGPATSTSQPSGTSTTGGGGTGTTLAASFTARLIGANTVPPVETASAGRLTMTVAPDGSSVAFRLEIDGLTNATSAGIYEGQPGRVGQLVLPLYDGPTKTGPFVGVLAEGPVVAADLTGSLQGKTLTDLIALIEAGDTYVSVANTSYPNGAIRGRVE